MTYSIDHSTRSNNPTLAYYSIVHSNCFYGSLKTIKITHLITVIIPIALLERTTNTSQYLVPNVVPSTTLTKHTWPPPLNDFVFKSLD